MPTGKSSLFFKHDIHLSGYHLIQVKRVVFYPSYRYDLFAKILAIFAKGKVCAKGNVVQLSVLQCKVFVEYVRFAGYPKDGMTMEEKVDYAESLSRETGFHIEPSEIFRSPAMETNNKIAINSLIGKQGQLNNKQSKTIVHSHSQLVELRGDGRIKIKSYRLLTEKMALVVHAPVDDRIQPYRFGCLLVAAYVTARGEIIGIIGNRTKF